MAETDRNGSFNAKVEEHSKTIDNISGFIS